MYKAHCDGGVVFLFGALEILNSTESYSAEAYDDDCRSAKRRFCWLTAAHQGVSDC